MRATAESLRAALALRGGERCLVYAVGGGRGHAARARRIAELLGGAEIVDAIPNGTTRDEWRRAIAAKLDAIDLLIVDTFPAGVARELDDELLARATKRALVVRHVKAGSYDGYDDLARAYDVRVAPYPAPLCENDCALCTAHAGFLVRDVAIDPRHRAACVVVGDARALAPGVRARIPHGAHVASSPFDALPSAAAYLAIGAGYNLTYELFLAGARAAHVPFERRYDDQFARADRIGRAIHSSRDLERFFVEEGPCASSIA
jgi:hypothetical protein